MKSLAILCATAALLGSVSCFGAFAEDATPQQDSIYPYEISFRENGGEPLIVKTYQVPDGTDPTALAEPDLSWMGRQYSLWGISRTEERDRVEEIDLTKTYTVSVPSNIPEEAAASVKEAVSYEADGYTGTLVLQILTCGDEMQEDGSYKGTAIYSGTVQRTTQGALCYELLYAPVEHTDAPAAPVESTAPTESVTTQPTAPQLGAEVWLLGGSLAVFGTVLLVCTVYGKGRRKETPKQPPAERPAKQKIYVPADDVVLDKEDDHA